MLWHKITEYVRRVNSIMFSDISSVLEEIKSKLLFIQLIAFILILLIAFYWRMNQLKKYNQLLFDKNETISNQQSELEGLNAQKDKFFSIIAHDLKNPLFGLLSFLELLNNKEINLEQKTRDEYLSLVLGTANNLQKSLENLLEWSRLQRGLIRTEFISIPLQNQIKGILGLQEANYSNKNIAIKCEIDENQTVYADENMFNSIIRNLLSNAIKFTSSGGNIEIKCKEDNDKVIISIQDSGIGIPKEMLPNLFELGHNTSRPGTEDETSTGLGLLICNEYAQTNNGRLWVESIEYVGSTFYLELPTKPAEY